MKCCICGQNLDGQPAMVDRATGEAFCPRDSHYFGQHPSNRPHRTTIQETKHETENENKEETKMTESLQPTDDDMRKSMKILNDAYLCRVNPELDKQIEAALASVLTAGEKGVQVLLDRLYDGISLSSGSLHLKNWGDYTWNELLKKREIIRALQKGNAKSAGNKLKDLLAANCRTGQWVEIVVPALRSAIEAIDASARQNEGVPHVAQSKGNKSWWQFWK
jgi:hypothetical protein